MTTSKKILIVGNGGAAMHAVQGARGAGYEGEIHVVSDVRGPAFNPMLSPYYLAGKIPFDRCYPFGDTFYETHQVIRHFGLKAEALDSANRKCFLAGRQGIHYDRCLVATGASPIMPPVSGLADCRHALVLRTAEQTRHLDLILPKVRRVLILGASLVGIKLAETLSARGIEVMLVDVAGHGLPHVAHPECAALIQNHLRECHVKLRLNRDLKGAEDVGTGIRLYFQDQESLDTDLCLVCTGIRANLDLLEETDVKRDRGVLVDYHMQTSAPALYAAGDVSQGMNLLSGEKEVIALWGNACSQGRTAGLNMAGRKSFYLGSVPQYVSAFFGMTFISMGDTSRKGDHIEISSCEDAARGCCRMLLFERGILIGFNAVNCFHEIGYLKAVISQRLTWPRSQGSGIDHPFWLREKVTPGCCAVSRRRVTPVSSRS